MYLFPFSRREDGVFRGWTLERIAAQPAIDQAGKRLEPGIIWLAEIALWADGKPRMQEMVKQVNAFLALPESQAALRVAKEQERAIRAGVAKERNRAAYQQRARQSEFADRNTERGY